MTQADRLKELVHYDPDTGVFLWREDKTNGIKAGDEAGGYTGRGYRTIRIDRELCFSHRLAFLYMTGELPTDGVDHINGVKDDNRWENLRHACQKVNNKNTKQRKDNKSGVTGVHWHKRDEVWTASIGVGTGGHVRHLGSFKDLDEAVATRQAAEKKFGYHTNHGRVE